MLRVGGEMRNFLAAVVMLLAAGSTIAAAQESQGQESKNEIAGTIGRTFVSDVTPPNTNFFDNTVHSGKGLSFEGDYARTLRRYFWGDLAVEIPIIINPDEDLNYGTDQIPKQYSSMFITPAARVTLIPKLAVSPWFSFGGGIGHFVGSKDLVFYGTNTGHRVKTTGVLQGGVGIDVRLPHLHSTRLRAEARDDWSGVASLNINTGNTR